MARARAVSAPARVLVTWVGQTDLNASRGDARAGAGPVGQAVAERDFDQVALLCNYPATDGEAYAAWLRTRTEAAVTLESVALSSPTDMGEIYQAVVDRLSALTERAPVPPRLTFHLSPGTPAMAAVWIIVARTRFEAELVESSREHGVKTAFVPFEISAEYLPAMLRRRDEGLAAMAAALPEASVGFEDIVHRSPQMRRVVDRARRVASRSVPVLIEGESGTGKELLARAIHEAGPRAGGPFVAVNCGAIVRELAESELFGHVKGAFTGATAHRAGHFEVADGGTLFLDEVGELPGDLQVKLLRALQEGQVTRVGASRAIDVDVRVIAATNRTLTREVSAGRFREDLFYRLAVAVIRMPPLRERSGDLGLLVDTLLERLAREGAADPGWRPKALTAGARNALLRHPWPGNVRELQNTLLRLLVWTEGDSIGAADVREALLEAPGSAGEGVLGRALADGFDLRAVIAEVATHYIERALAETGGSRPRAAALLGLGSYQTLGNWMRKYRIPD
ncbi:MAG: sigma-54-dependent Fis family transcriptional regulator [Chromatiales bacterium]|nr:sigma-54-dependent Fis family transcriptional regulator [Chromatiales bacterium]